MAIEYHSDKPEIRDLHALEDDELTRGNNPSVGSNKLLEPQAAYNKRRDDEFLYAPTNGESSDEMKLTSGGKALHALNPTRLQGVRRSRFDKSSAVQCAVGILCFLALVNWHITPFSPDRSWFPRLRTPYTDASRGRCASPLESLEPSGPSFKHSSMTLADNLTRKVDILANRTHVAKPPSCPLYFSASSTGIDPTTGMACK